MSNAKLGYIIQQQTGDIGDPDFFGISSIEFSNEKNKEELRSRYGYVLALMNKEQPLAVFKTEKSAEEAMLKLVPQGKHPITYANLEVVSLYPEYYEYKEYGFTENMEK